MPKRYPEEFRRKVLDLVACGRPVAQIAADLSVSRRSRPSLSHGPLHFLRRPRRIAQNSSDSRAGSVSIDLSGRCHPLAS